jgi:hypothetical protein
MTKHGGYRGDGGSTNAARTRHGPAKRIGWTAAGRLVDGKNGGPGTEELGALIAVAAAPASDAATDVMRLEPVLTAFRRAGVASAPQREARRAIRPRSSRAVLVKFATLFLILAGSGVAAASAGVLPAPMQRIAHDYFGGVGIPAPSVSGGAGSISPSGTPSASGSPSPTPGPGDTTAANAAQLMPLCQTVAANSQNWRSVLDATDQAALIAAAGSPGHVPQYCAALLADSSNGASAGAPGTTSTPGQPSEPSSRPSPDASATHGNGHASHSPSPNPHSTGH